MSSLQRYPGLDAYWPPMEEVSAIATEAEALDDAVLLAVHRDIDMIKRPFAGGTSHRVSQEDLLEHVLNGLKPEGYLLIPITGPSGVGKSHLVRWLEIRLRRHPRASRFHLVRVPKSASLRSVIEAILRPVADMAEYRELFAAVRDATSALSADEATTMFGAMLELALREKAKEWREAGGLGPTLGGVPVARLVVHASKLADFLQDPVVAPYFRTSVYPRLLERALTGRHQDSANADRLPQFELDDLTLPTAVERELTAAAHGTRVYYSTHLERGRAEALLTLNAVVDSAVARVFKLGQSLQGRTLQDIMRDIRERLHEEGRELVLLVEDFYALTGIQEQLLSLCIQGTMDVSAGGKPLCPMRTVMAMTDSTLDGRDTIKTRSEFQWSLMAEQESDDRVLKGLLELCGRYLNAARIGRAELQRRYNAVDATVSISFTPAHDHAESDDVLRAFGKTDSGLELFPLTQGAIHFLARKYLQEGGRLVFNPRRALQHILREVLLARESFVRGTFPIGLSIDDPIPVELSPLLGRQPEPLRLRYQRLIVCWGNDPQTEAELRRVPPEVFLGFGLPTPFAAQPTPIPTATPEPTWHPTPSPTSGPDPADAVNAEWRQTLNDWTRNQRLTHQQTNTLRKLIIEHVKNHVDWNVLCLSRDELDQESIGLPNTLGQVRKHLPERPVIQVTGPKGLTDVAEPELALELLALLRFNRVKSWGYKDGDQDSFQVYGLLDRIATQLERAAVVAAEIKLSPLAKMALRSAAVRLGMPSAEARLALLQRTLEVADPAPENSGAAPWDELRQACWVQRQAMRGLVLRYVQVVQGTADTPYAVDGERLVRALSGPAPDTQALRPVREHDNAVAQEVKTLLGNLAEARIKASAKEALKKVTDWKRTALDKTGLHGSQEEASELAHRAKELITSATLSHCWPASTSQQAWPDPATQMAQAVKFGAVPWSQLVQQIGEVMAQRTDSLDAMLSSLPTLPWTLLGQCQAFLQVQTALLAAIETKIDAEESILGTGGGQTAAITEVKQHLEMLDSSLHELTEGQA